MAWTIRYDGDVAALDPWRGHIEACVYDVEEAVEPLLGRFAVDLCVRMVRGGGIAELGLGGGCFRPGRIDLTLDPTHPRFLLHLGSPFERIVAHEAHHAARWLGPGYGRTLGEALVTEGLAGHFVRELFGSTPEPWERALAKAELSRWTRRALGEAGDPMYDHARWFFGRGDIPRWAGYSIGYDLVKRFLAADGGTASAHVDTPAVGVLDAARRAGAPV